jgi:hypothetical protein
MFWYCVWLSFYVSHSCYQMRWSSVQLMTGWQLAPVFQVCIQVYHVKSVRNTGLRYLQKLMRFVVKAWVVWNIQKSSVLLWAYILCRECNGLQSVTWHDAWIGTFLSFLFKAIISIMSHSLSGIFTNKNILVYSVVLCSVFSLYLLILLLFAYMHCRNERELTYCVKCILSNVDVVFEL